MIDCDRGLGAVLEPAPHQYYGPGPIACQSCATFHHMTLLCYMLSSLSQKTRRFFVCECGMRNVICMLMYTDVDGA